MTRVGLAAFLVTASAQRLRITNGCGREPLWVAHMAGADNGPDPQNVKLEPGEHRDFDTHDGLSSTRYWPKMRCNEQGSACLIGESGGPGQECNETMGCAPPIDSKFEGTFGTEAGIDWIDVSLVDGWTLPFKFQMTLKGKGKCNAGDGNRSVPHSVDCSTLTLDKCPASEVLHEEKTNLQVIHPGAKQVVGCYSPCAKLTSNNWNNEVADGVSPADDKAVEYCCPTPPESPEACRSGPVEQTAFVKSVHKNCPGVYGYSYDDGMGLITCPKDTKYEMIFYCPDGEGALKTGSDSSESADSSAPLQPGRTNDDVGEDGVSEDDADGVVTFLREEETKYPKHEYCADKSLFEGTVESQLACQGKCRSNERCFYYSWWITGGLNWCVLTPSCSSRDQDDVEKVAIYSKRVVGGSSDTTAKHEDCCFEDDTVENPCSMGCKPRSEVANGFCVPRDTWCDSCVDDPKCGEEPVHTKGNDVITDAKRGELVVMRKDAFHAFVRQHSDRPGGALPVPWVVALASAAMLGVSATALKLRRAMQRDSGSIARVILDEASCSNLFSPGPGSPAPPRSP
jgi:hypothetical protein